MSSADFRWWVHPFGSIASRNMIFPAVRRFSLNTLHVVEASGKYKEMLFDWLQMDEIN